MANLRPKITIVFLPYVLVSATVILVMSLAKWLFEVKYRLLMFDTFRFDVIVSTILSFILIITILRRRIRILDIRDKNNEPIYGVYYFFMLVSIVLPVNFAINYVGAAGYRLKHVNNAMELVQQPVTRYYDIDTIRLLKKGLVVSFERYTTSRSETLNFDCYAAYPFATDDSTPVPDVWYVLSYNETMDNQASRSKKDSAYQRFRDDCTRRIEDAYVSAVHPAYFDNIPDNIVRRNVLNKVLYYTGFPESVVLLAPVYGSFEQRTENNGVYFLLSWLAGILMVFFMVMVKDYNNAQLNMYYNNTILSNDALQKGIHFLHRRWYHPLVLMIMIIIIIVFVVLVKLLC